MIYSVTRPGRLSSIAHFILGVYPPEPIEELLDLSACNLDIDLWTAYIAFLRLTSKLFVNI